jgi:hypothetical protein
MTLTKGLNSLGGRCRSFFDSALPKGAKVKSLQGILGLSYASAERIAGGHTPTTAHLIVLARHFGHSFVDYIFADVVERPSAAELAEVEAIGRALNEQAVVAAPTAPAVAVVAEAGSLRPSPSTEDRRASGLVVVRRSLAEVAGRKSHLATHLRRWSESLGLAERSSLRAMGEKTPHLRTSITTQRGDDLIYGYISPAFRLHANDREKLIGRSTTDTFDKDYAGACANNTRAVIASGKPAVDDVRARVKVEPGVILDLTYRRLILPYVEGGTRVAVCASEPLAGVA